MEKNKPFIHPPQSSLLAVLFTIVSAYHSVICHEIKQQCHLP